MRVFAQYSDNTLIAHLYRLLHIPFSTLKIQASFHHYVWGKQTLFCSSVYMLIPKTWTGALKPLKPALCPTIWLRYICSEIRRFTVKTYIVFQRIHVRTRALRPDTSLQQPCARRRQGGGVAASLSDGRGTVYTPEPRRPPGATRTYLFATFARQDIRCERGTASSAPLSALDVTYRAPTA